MENRWANLGFPRRNPPFPAMLSGCGRERRTHASYLLDGEKRGEDPYWVFQYTLSGGGWLRYEGKIMRPGPGEAMMLRIPHTHVYGFKPDKPEWDFLWSTLTGTEVDQVLGTILKRNGPVYPLAAGSPAIELMVSMINRASAGDFSCPYEASAAAFHFAMRLAAALSPRLPSIAENNRISAAIEFAQAHFREPIGVLEMAEAAELSRHHFSRSFHTETGTTPVAFLKRLRLAEALRILQMPGPVPGIKSVASASGFGDLNHFIKCFRQAYGVTPGRFRTSGLYGAPIISDGTF